MKKEIRQEIREYILSEVNTMLARLGVSEPLKETKEYESNGTLYYWCETRDIRQQPMMFKRAYVDGYMVSIEIKKEDDRFYELSQEYDIVVVNFDWRWESFRYGFNGTEIGRVIYAVDKKLPEKFNESPLRGDVCNYVRKVEGLEL